MSKELSKALYETAKDLYDSGLIDIQTMRGFDKLALPKVRIYTPLEIQRLRKRNHASQAVFAAYLNTTLSTVQKWEQGQKKPNGVALKLLNLVQKRGLEVLAA